MAILTASFKNFIIISCLITIHELGHFSMAKLLNVEVDKIYLYPLGGISKFFLPINATFIKEFLILITGPIFQCFAQGILLLLFPESERLIIMYHYGILIFNLLPIYPLDGGKLVQLLLATLFPYKKSLELSIIISYVMIVIYFLVNLKTIKINSLIITLFLVHKVSKEQKKIKLLHERFILERYLHNYSFKKSRIVPNTNYFYKNTHHLIKEQEHYYLEKEYLEKKYKKFPKNC